MVGFWKKIGDSLVVKWHNVISDWGLDTVAVGYGAKDAQSKAYGSKNKERCGCYLKEINRSFHLMLKSENIGVNVEHAYL